MHIYRHLLQFRGDFNTVARSKKSYVEKHERLMKLITESDGVGCYSVRGLAKSAKMDQRTARAHLEIMSLHGMGKYLDDQKRVFCTKAGVKNLAEKVGYTVQEQSSQ
jgi:hypothetical protein